MKNFLVSFLVLIIFSIPILPQTNSVTRFNAKESEGLYKVEATFTADSNDTAFYTDAFSVPKYDVEYSATLPITFHFKVVGTYGTPSTSLILQGNYQGNYVNLDTLRLQAVAQIETDSTGALTLNAKFAPSYRLLIKTTTADVHSGVVGMYFPIKQRNYR